MTERSLAHRVGHVGSGPIVAMLAILGMLVGLAVAMNTGSYDVWGAFWVGPVLLALTVPIARWVARTEGDASVGRIILIAFAVKVIGGSLARYVMVHGLYGGGDSDRYSTAGKVLAPMFRQGEYTNLGKISGTRFIEVLTGQVFAGIGPTSLGGFLVFSWFAFVGLVLLVRAFRIAVPNGDHRRYRLLVLFFSTLVFWPSSIGKDAWMLLCLGAAAYGLAHVLTGRVAGLVPAALGVWGAAVVRPHIALLLLVGAGVAIMTRTAGATIAGRGGGIWRALLAGAVLVLAVVIVMGRAQDFLGLNSLDPESADSALTEVVRRTAQGGSQFDAPDPSSPLGYVMALLTVLFRPFPGEAGGAGLIASGEGLLFLGVVVASLGRLSRIPVQVLRAPYVMLALVYLLAFAYAFSAIENFGILARQRAQLLPFAFVLLALPKRPGHDAHGRRPRAEPATAEPARS